MNRDGSPYVTIDQLDKDMVAISGKMKVGEYSQPVALHRRKDREKRCKDRLPEIPFRTTPYELHDDYSKISQFATGRKESKGAGKMDERKNSYLLYHGG